LLESGPDVTGLLLTSYILHVTVAVLLLSDNNDDGLHPVTSLYAGPAVVVIVTVDPVIDTADATTVTVPGTAVDLTLMTAIPDTAVTVFGAVVLSCHVAPPVPDNVNVTLSVAVGTSWFVLSTKLAVMTDNAVPFAMIDVGFADATTFVACQEYTWTDVWPDKVSVSTEDKSYPSA
jgi:hypothetical protein